MRYTYFDLGTGYRATEVAADRIGDRHRMSYDRAVNRSELDRISVQVAGAWSYRNEGDQELHQRVPGMVSSELGDSLAAGVYSFVALTPDARHYCIRKLDKSTPFAPGILRVSAGAEFFVPHGKFLFLCAGQIEIGGSYQGERYFMHAESAAVQAYAVTDALGLLL